MASNAEGSQSSTESSESSSPRLRRNNKQSNTRGTRSEYAAFKALLRNPAGASQPLRIRHKSRSISRRPSTVVPSSVEPDSDSESDESSSSRQEEFLWPKKSHLDLTAEPRLDELIKSFAGEYVRRKGLQLQPETDAEAAPSDQGEAGHLDHGFDPELLSTLSTNVIRQFNATLVNLAVQYRGRQSKQPLTGRHVLGARHLTSIPENHTLLDSLSEVIDEKKLKLHAHRLNIVREALNARPLAPRAAFYAPLKPRRDRKTAKYYERARKRNRATNTNVGP